MIPCRKQFPVSVLCYKYKTVVIVKKLRFIAIWQQLYNVFKSCAGRCDTVFRIPRHHFVWRAVDKAVHAFAPLCRMGLYICFAAFGDGNRGNSVTAALNIPANSFLLCF